MLKYWLYCYCIHIIRSVSCDVNAFKFYRNCLGSNFCDQWTGKPWYVFIPMRQWALGASIAKCLVLQIGWSSILHILYPYMRTLVPKQVSQAGKGNCIPQYSVGCNYLALPEVPASGTKVLIYRTVRIYITPLLSSQHHVCWWPDYNTRKPDISRYDIDLVSIGDSYLVC